MLGFAERNGDFDFGALIRSGNDFETAADFVRAFADAEQSEMAGLGTGRFVAGKAAAIVLYGKANEIRCVMQIDRNGFGIRMLEAVGDGFLADAQQMTLDV